MCEKCEEVVELLEYTKGVNSGDWTVVEFSFPNGTPKLVKKERDAQGEDERRGNSEGKS